LLLLFFSFFFFANFFLFFFFFRQVPGFDALASDVSEILDATVNVYETFVDVMRWREKAFEVLAEVAQTSAALSVIANPFLTYRYLELVSQYIRLHVLMSMVADRKAVLAVYGKCFELSKTTMEPDFAKVALYVCEFENPFKRIVAEFKPICGRVAQALVGLKPVLDKALSLDMMHQEGAISLTQSPMALGLPAQAQFDFDAVLTSKFHEWVLYGLLFTPEEYAMKDTMPMARQALQQGYLAPLFRDETLAIHHEYEQLFSTYKSQNKQLKLGKEKKTIRECASQAVGAGARAHKQMRAYARQELSTVITMLEDFPGLCGPKFQVALHALSLARAEIFWYFRHRSAPPPSVGKKHYREEDYGDPHMIVLLSLVLKVKQVLQHNRKVVQAYYLEFLHGQDCKHIKELVASTFASMSPGKVEMDALQSIIKELESIDIQAFLDGRLAYDFRGLRLNWYRIEAAMSLQSAPVAIVRARELSLKFHQIVWHTRNVDEIDALLDEFGSLADLWYHKRSLFMECDLALASGRHAGQLGAVFGVLNELPFAATKYGPAGLRPRIGAEVAAYAERYVGQIADKIGMCLMLVADEYSKFAHQTDPSAAAYAVLANVGVKVPGEPPEAVGSESLYKNKMQTIPIRMSLRAAWALCTVLQRNETIVVFDTKLAPREYLRDKLSALASQFIKRVVGIMLDKEPGVQRPSVIEREMSPFRQLLMNIESYVDIDVADILRRVLLAETYHASLEMKTGGADSAFAWVTAEPLAEMASTLAGRMATWYANAAAARLTGGPPAAAVVYSPARLCFVSRAGNPFRASEYFNVVELESLARLVGPYGMRLLDRELLRVAMQHVAAIKQHVAANQPAYEELAKTYGTPRADAAMRSIRDLEQFASAAISFGNVHALRSLARRALASAMRRYMPLAARTVATARGQYESNLTCDAALLAADTVAADCGLDVALADQALLFAVKRSSAASDAATHALLPVAFAGLLFSRTVQDSAYIKHLEAHTSGANVLPAAFSQLMYTLRAAGSGSPADAHQHIVAAHKQYVDVAASIVLRWSLPAESGRNKIQSLPSVAILVDIFVQASPLLTKDTLQNVIPYSLIRSFYREIYSSRTPKGF
jgi:NCK-associated protein 1